MIDSRQLMTSVFTVDLKRNEIVDFLSCRSPEDIPQSIFKISKSNEFLAVSVSRGLGHYTSLKISSSVSKALCYSLDIPLVSFYGLEILHHQSALRITEACWSVVCTPFNDSGAGLIQVYCGKIPYSPVYTLELSQEAVAYGLKYLYKAFDWSFSKVLFLGDCALIPPRDGFKEFSFDCRSFDTHFSLTKSLAEISCEKYRWGHFENLNLFVPQYKPERFL